MEEYKAYVGLEVHKETIAVAVAYPGRGKAEPRGIIPNNKRSLVKLVDRLERDGNRLLFRYEAGPCGYEIHRMIVGWGHEFQVVGPSKTPRKPGDRVKTDRRDSRKLAEMLRSGDLTAETSSYTGARDRSPLPGPASKTTVGSRSPLPT